MAQTCNAAGEKYLHEAVGELELELIQTQMTQKPMLRAEVGMRVRCANEASAECIMREGPLAKILAKIAKSEAFVGSA